MLRMYYLIFKVHTLGDTLVKTADEIEEHLTLNDNIMQNMDKVTKYKVKKMCKDMRDMKTFSPYGIFTINQEAFLSIIAVSLTYIVVLMQFKTSEIQLKS